jgi:hypothetical protein
MYRFLFLAFLLGASLLASAGCQGSNASPPAPVLTDSHPLQIAGPIDLGVVPAGGSCSRIVQYINRSESAHRLAGFETSCNCVSVRFLPLEIGPQGQGYLRIELDLKSYSCGATGHLTFDVQGYDQSHHLLLSTEVRVHMIPSDVVSAALPEK